MSRYRLNPAHSDQPLSDGDGAFLRFASRRQSTVLPPGYLELSVNMQLDRATAKVRPAIAPAVTDISLTTPAVILDFALGTVLVISQLSRVGTTATCVTSTAHGRTTGDTVAVFDAAQSEYNGEVVITVTGANTFTYTTPAAGTPADSLLETAVTSSHSVSRSTVHAFASYALSVYAKPNGRDHIRLAASFSDGGSAASFFNITTGVLGTSSVTAGAGGRPTGVSRSMTAVGDGWYRCSLYYAASALSITNTIGISTNGVAVSYLGDITKGVFLYGAQLEQAGGESAYERTTLVAGVRNLFTYSEAFDDASWTKTGLTISADSVVEPGTGASVAVAFPIIYEDYASSVRCSCMFATRDVNRTEYAIIATTTQAYAVRPGAASQSILYPANETIESTDDASMIYWNGRVFLFRGYQQAAAVVISGVAQVAGTATCTTATAHGLATNDWAYLEEVIPYGYGGIVQVTVTGANTFTYAVNAALASPATVSTTGSKVRKCKRPLYWDGNFANPFAVATTGPIGTGGTYIHLPPVPWAIDIHNRLLIPWRADQILFSDPYDSDTYDTVYEQFRLRYGSFDQLVAAVPAPASVVFVLCRRSLHRLILDEQNLVISTAEEITRDVGCLARRTVRSQGGTTLWLGDRAIHRVRLTDQLNLVPEALPLSDDVQDIIDSINWAYAAKATAVVWGNRYYLAIPVGTSTRNNVVLVYNFINEGWESKNTFPTGFDVEEWHLMDSGGQKKLFASTTYGFLYDMADETKSADMWGSTSSQQSYTISGQFDTRYYTGGTPEVKRCRRMFLEANLAVGDSFTAQVITRNPDHNGDVVALSASAVNDGRYPIYGGLSGSGAKLRVLTTGGRPEFRAVECDFSAVRERHSNQQT